MSETMSARLKRNANRVMTLWAERAVEEVPATTHLETLALRNSLPDYLDHLADALSTKIHRTAARGVADRKEGVRVGKKHGSERAGSQNFTIDQLIFEYHILRQVIFDVLEEEVPVSPEEREVIVTSIEQAVNDAATEFSDRLRDIQEAFMHALAHDLRTPLTAAKASAQLILRRPEDVNASIIAASRISHSMDRLDSMIHDLLDASRLRAGESLQLEYGTCDLDLLARQVVDEANDTHGDRFALRSSGECVGYWSEDGLRRVIENLTTNAAKYGAPGTPITVQIAQTEDAATLTVHNEGAPILAEDRAILFEQFRRSHATGTKTGWGLGLTVVKGIAESHHGTIEVESEAGQGTTFSLTLPKDFRETKNAAAKTTP